MVQLFNELCLGTKMAHLYVCFVLLGSIPLFINWMDACIMHRWLLCHHKNSMLKVFSCKNLIAARYDMCTYLHRGLKRHKDAPKTLIPWFEVFLMHYNDLKPDTELTMRDKECSILISIHSLLSTVSYICSTVFWIVTHINCWWLVICLKYKYEADEKYNHYVLNKDKGGLRHNTVPGKSP